MAHALIVDDDLAAADTLAAVAVSEKFTVDKANTLEQARRAIAERPPDVVLLDLQLPDGSGLELLDDPELMKRSEVVLITGNPTVETSIQALRLGAADYLPKPVDVNQLRAILSGYRKPAVIDDEVAEMFAECDRSGRFGLMWGRSPAMRRVYQQISRVATSSVTVLVACESGTGKELVAQTVHNLSRRRGKPFFAMNCGAISPNLIESEIFGHEKGSFTGADRQRIGYFERADGGTLFLDEVTEMPLDLQVKLLRVLEYGTFRRVGSTEDLSADVRIVAATNRVPEQAVAQGKLREDLLYRLNVFPITVPPLHSRGDDVVLIATQFIDELARREGAPKHLGPAALRRLATYRWPGNVRELRNAMQRAYLMTTEPVITDEWLPSDDMLAQQPHHGGDNAVTIPLGSSLADAERTLILATLRHLDYHKDRTAAVLGVSRKTLYNRLQEYASGSLGPPDSVDDEVDSEPA
jgi:two-component system response regulator AtoC